MPAEHGAASIWADESNARPRFHSSRPSAGSPRRSCCRAGARSVVELGEHHYRRSEQEWRHAGEPAGSVALERVGDTLRVVIEVAVSELTFATADATNPYDNEVADINGDSVQLYLRSAGGLSAWMLVPTLESLDVRQRVIEGWAAPHPIKASWERTGTGYRIDRRARRRFPMRST